MCSRTQCAIRYVSHGRREAFRAQPRNGGSQPCFIIPCINFFICRPHGTRGHVDTGPSLLLDVSLDISVPRTCCGGACVWSMHISGTVGQPGISPVLPPPTDRPVAYPPLDFLLKMLPFPVSISVFRRGAGDPYPRAELFNLRSVARTPLPPEEIVPVLYVRSQGHG